MPALRRLRQEDCKCEASLVYIVRHCLKNKWIWAGTQLLEWLPSTQEALDATPPIAPYKPSVVAQAHDCSMSELEMGAEEQPQKAGMGLGK